ncbi:MAG: DsrE/DsrF/DrsH-like family protein [Actinomycetia bacterium]|nr:DsrE/DsrF/DrsH-like family protein [Actinomycetes bacterium]
MNDKEKATIVVFSGELDKAFAAFIIANTAATMGMEVTMFFTFWGLNVIKKNRGSIPSKGWMRKMLNKMNRGGSKRLKLSKFHMFGMGTKMMKKLMKEVNLPSIEEMIKMADDLGVKMVACTTTLGVMGVGKEAFIPEAQEICGAAAFIGEAKESKISLFI